MSLIAGITRAAGQAENLLDRVLAQAGLIVPFNFGGDFNDFLARVQQASFRGVPFGVVLGESRFGRRLAVHDYPFRDTQWAEDLGKGTRKFAIQGFLITDSLIYGGGDVIDQRERLIAAVEQKGKGTLIHPTLGSLEVSIPEDGLIVTERLDGATFMEFTLACVETGERKFPSASADQADNIQDAAAAVDEAASGDFISDVFGALNYGSFVIDQAVRNATDWIDIVDDAVFDATGVFNLASSLPGNFGRYFNGALVGYALNFLDSPVPLTLENLTFAAAQHRDAVRLAGDRLVAACRSGDPSKVPTAAQAAAAALAASIVNPADGVRLFALLAIFYPSEPTGPSVIGQAAATMQNAIGALLRRTALAALVRVTETYAPQSAADANQVRLKVGDLLEMEAIVAGDSGDDASFKALSAARGTVAVDLDQRGSALPPMRRFTFPQSLPALVVAQRLYQDSGRTDELIRLANAQNPVFMPLEFIALSS